MMNRSIFFTALVAPFFWACGATFPPPVQRMADAQSAERSARELGANNQPEARLSLKLAQEQIALAKKSIASGENERADSLLIRAKADAELAVVQAREKVARADVKEAVDDSAAQKDMNAGQGAVQ
jgi:hypothetical protein